MRIRKFGLHIYCFYLRILYIPGDIRLLQWTPEVEGPDGGLHSFPFTGKAGKKKVLEAGHLLAETAGCCNLLETLARFVIWCGRNTVNTPPSFPG
jgi:hypothetical protein